MKFQIPTVTERLAAVGDIEGLSTRLRRALTPAFDFDPIPPPRPGDWLTVHPEPGQTFDEFIAAHPNRPTERRRILYLQPIGQFPKDRSPSLGLLEEFGAAFFDLPVKRLPVLPIAEAHLTTRTNPMSGIRQIRTGDVLRLLKKRLPEDAFCTLAVLHYALGFDTVDRYRRLLDFYRSVGWSPEAEWVENRLTVILKGAGS